MKRIFVILIAVFSLVSLTPAYAARDQVGLESTYLGDGWFKYRLYSADDPFFPYFDLGGLLLSFTNYVELGSDPQGWTNNSALTDSGQVYWMASNCGYVFCQSRPYERTFFVRSAERHFKKSQPQEASFISFSFANIANSYSGAVTMNIAGYVRLECLLPCPAEQADNYPTNMLSSIQIYAVPDISVRQLITTNSDVYGVSFEYCKNGASTLRLDGSFDLTNWNKIAYIHSTNCDTQWTTNQPLNSYGTFYRLQLVADYFKTNLPPLNLLSAAMASSPLADTPPSLPSVADCPRILSYAPTLAGVELKLASSVGRKYEITILDRENRVLSIERRTALFGIESIPLSIPDVPQHLFFVVRP